MNKNDKPAATAAEGVAELSRRHFLKTATVFGTSAAALLSAPSAVFAADAPVLPSGFKSLSDFEFRILDRLRVVLLPTEKFNLPSTTAVPVMQNLDDMVSRLSSTPRTLLRVGLHTFEYGSIYKFSRFSQLDDERAYNQVESWQNGIFFQRGLMTNIKTLVAFAYWRDPRTWTALEYDGPVTEKWGIKRLGNAPMPHDA